MGEFSSYFTTDMYENITSNPIDNNSIINTQTCDGRNLDKDNILWLIEVIFFVSILCLGIFLNSIILWCYCGIKGRLAPYLRNIAVFDISTITTGTTSALINLFLNHCKLYGFMHACYRFLLPFSMLGPLFLAIDSLFRSFPIKALKPDFVKRMWRLKLGIFIMTFTLSACRFGLFIADTFFKCNSDVKRAIDYASKITVINMMLQFVLCFVLYLIFTVNMSKVDRNLRDSKYRGKK